MKWPWATGVADDSVYAVSVEHFHHFTAYVTSLQLPSLLYGRIESGARLLITARLLVKSAFRMCYNN
jgi:hypothetical protein